MSSASFAVDVLLNVLLLIFPVPEHEHCSIVVAQAARNHLSRFTEILSLPSENHLSAKFGPPSGEVQARLFIPWSYERRIFYVLPKAFFPAVI